MVFCGGAVADAFIPVAQWDMEAIVSGKVADSASAVSGLNNALVINPTDTPPTVVSGYTGNALSFNGENNRGQSTFFWSGYESFKFEAWINPARIEAFDGNDQYIFNIWLSTQIRCRGGRFYLDVRNAANTAWTTISSSATHESDNWYYVIAFVDKDGNMTLQVDEEITTGSTPDGGWYSSFSAEYIYLGASRHNTANFEGLIDEVKISALKYVDDSYYKENDRGTLAIYRMENITSADVLGDVRDVIADDEGGDVGRGYPLVLGKRPDMGYLGMEPTLTDDQSGKFGKALSFDGFDDMVWFERWRGSDYLKFEAWVMPNDFTNYSTRYPMLFEISSRVRVWYRGGRLRMVVRKPDNSGWTAERWLTVPEGKWDHITVEVNPDGSFTLTSLYGKITDSTGQDGWLHSEVMYVVMGNDRANVNTAAWYFNGLIDDVKISDIKMPCDGADYPVGDLNQDCVVDLADLALFLADWLKCTTPGVSGCINLN